MIQQRNENISGKKIIDIVSSFKTDTIQSYFSHLHPQDSFKNNDFKKRKYSSKEFFNHNVLRNLSDPNTLQSTPYSTSPLNQILIENKSRNINKRKVLSESPTKNTSINSNVIKAVKISRRNCYESFSKNSYNDKMKRNT